MKYVCSLVMILFCMTVQACQQPCKSFCSKEDRSSVMGSIRSNLVRLGDSIENAEAPVFGKLGNILPFAIVGFCLQKLPEQTMMVLGGLLLYVIFNSDSVRGVLHTQEKVKQGQKQKNTSPAVSSVAPMSKERCTENRESNVIIENDMLPEETIIAQKIIDQDVFVPLSFLEENEPVMTKRPLSFL